MGGLGAGLPGLGGGGGPGPGQIPPPPGGLGSGLLALGSVAGALVGHPYGNQYGGNQMKDEKVDRDRTVIICVFFLLILFFLFSQNVNLKGLSIDLS